MSPPEDRPTGPALPTSETAGMALREAAALLAPVVRWMLRSGVSYPAFADAMKTVFMDAARAELDDGGMPASQSALSVLSGVHRKDVRALLAAGSPPVRPGPGVPLATQVCTHWLQDPALRDRAGRPRALPRSGPPPSFDALSRSLSTDVHPRTVLDELLRLGVVTVSEEQVVLQTADLAPAGDLAARTARFAARSADHLAAAVHNLGGGEPLFLEDAVGTAGLSPEAVNELAELAQRLWSQASVAVAEAGCKRSGGGGHRVRFGAYFYAQEPEAPTAAAPPSRGGRRRAGPSRAA